MEDQIIEIFGKRVKIVKDNGNSQSCTDCAISLICKNIPEYPCADANKYFFRHFVEVDECSVFDSKHMPVIDGTQMIYMRCSDDQKLVVL